MPKTISVHNGTAAHRAHNLRDPKVLRGQIYDPTTGKGHIDPTLMHKNEYLIDIPPREAYRQIFGDALDKYNAKQKRPERRISDYYDHIKADKQKHAVYEVIIQIGDREDTGINAPVERSVIKEFIDGWDKRNPNLILIGAYLHADEHGGTLHAHLNYIPIAKECKRGLETQNALTKGLGQQGFNTEKKTVTETVIQADGSEKNVKTILTAQSRWQESERQALTTLCNTHEIEVERRVQKIDHLDTPEYKARQDSLNALDAAIAQKQSHLEAAQADLADLSLQAARIATEQQEAIGGIETLENKKNALQGEIGGLQAKFESARAATQQEEKMKQQIITEITELETEHNILQESVKKGTTDAMSQFGSMERVHEMIAQKKQMREKETRYNLFERFLEQHPKIKSMFEQFVQLITRGKEKKRSRNEPSR